VVGAPGDGERALVDHPVVESARLVVVGVVAADDATARELVESVDGQVQHQVSFGRTSGGRMCSRR
jgi:hypothetical protein